MAKHNITTRIIALLTSVAYLVLVVGNSSVAAISKKDLEDILNGYSYYDSTDTTSSCSSAGSSSAGGAANEGPIYSYLIGKGLTPPQAAGIMGNMEAESHFEPRLVEYGYPNSRGEISRAGQPSSLDDKVPPNAKSNGQPGYGLVQFTNPGFKDGLRNLAASTSRGESDLTLQLDYLWQLLNGDYKGVLRDIQAATTLEGSTKPFLFDFEKPANKEAQLAGRTKNGQNILAKYGSTSPDTSVATPQIGVTTSIGGCSTGASGTVDATGYAFPIAPQTKSGNKTVANLSQVPCNNPGSCHHNEDGPLAGYAFDLGRQPGGESSVGAAVYAISDGTISSAHIYNRVPGCYSLQLQSSKDNFYYWYGHMQNMTVKDGDVVKSGQQIAEIGQSKCALGSTPHLHIDRGCIQGGVPQQGGNGTCRDPGIVPLINSLYAGLPD
jgi:hypothetical protein